MHSTLQFIQKSNTTPLQNRFFLIAGPCAVESEENAMHIAEKMVEITQKLQIPYVFKASYVKANRSKSSSFTGIGNEKALYILQKIKTTFNIPITTDIHTAPEADLAAQYGVDILQIPAFLCRQTDLLVAAAKTNAFVNIKKGQFLSAEAMQFALEKIHNCNNPNTLLTERGTTFGYHDLIVDYRNIPLMQALGAPVVLDCTHALQQPNQPAGVTGGQPHFIPAIAKAGVAVGVNGLFIETHPSPSQALSDGANMLPLSKMETMLTQLVQLKEAVVNF